MIVISEEIDGKAWAIVLDERGEEIARYPENRAAPEFAAGDGSPARNN